MFSRVSEVLPYLHPLIAALTLVLAWLVFRQGLHQRTQRLRRVTAPSGSRQRHVRLGPVVTALFVVSAGSGALSAVLLRDWKPLASFHGKLGLLSVIAFGVMWLWGRRLVGGEQALANRHGVLGVIAMFLAGLTAVLGISLLP